MENTIHKAHQAEKALIDSLVHQANTLFEQGSLHEAEQLYESILENNPLYHPAALKIALIALQQNNLAKSIQFMQTAASIAPNIALYQRNLGELLRRAKQFEDAIKSHKIAIRLEPTRAEHYFLLALTYHDCRHVELAMQHYRTALSYDQCHGPAWNNLGSLLESIDDREAAKVAYNNAININPNHAEAQNNLGAIYAEEGQLDKARIHFKAALINNPEFIDAHYNLSLIKTYSLDDPEFQYLESLIEKIHQYPDRYRIYYYFTFAKALHDTQQYDRAFIMYAEGNRLHYLNHPWDKTKLQHFVENLPVLFTESFFKKSQDLGEVHRPIFIVGMPRSGTTLIEQILSSHHAIHGAGELSTLDDIIQEACSAMNLSLTDWIKQLTDEQCLTLRKNYLDRTSKLGCTKSFLIDKMPGNCFYIGIIYRLFPQAKVIHSMRDAMDSCFSCFTHLFKSNLLFSYDLNALGTYYTLYANAMKHWYAVLPKGTLFDVSYEKMVADQEALSKQLLEYIGLPWDENCLHFYKNNRPVKTASVSQVRQPIYKTSMQRWRHFSHELEPLREILANIDFNGAYVSQQQL